MENPKQKLLERIRESTNVLVTVSNNPSVDQLAGAIGLTLLLNKLGKHATAVFSGEVPDVLEFLKPDDTLEKNTDSLRDFIIALDKAKADKLRYKVEDKMVKIFITPYHTAISEKDLEFSQGDYNVDVVVALGVHQQKDLDQAITSHGRILHDATVSSINNQSTANIGTINWLDTAASSLCEMLYELITELKADALDAQMSTALLTGIVAETHRFGNAKTTAKSMETSARLVALGANQQLVAAKLEDKPQPIPEKSVPVEVKPAVEPEKAGATNTHKDPEAIPQAAGALKVDHKEGQEDTTTDEQIHIDEHGMLQYADKPKEDEATDANEAEEQETTSEPETDTKLPSNSGPRIVLQPPTLGGKLTANSEPEHLDPATDPLGKSDTDALLLSHGAEPATSDSEPDQELPEPQPVVEQKESSEQPAEQQSDTQTLTEIEQAVESPHADVGAEAVQAAITPDLDSARDAVVDAVNSSTDVIPPPRVDLNAQPMDLALGQQPNPMAAPPEPFTPPLNLPTTNDPSGLPPGLVSTDPPSVSSLPSSALPPNLVPVDPGMPADNTASPSSNATAPPPVPPPMMPPGFVPPANTGQNDETPQNPSVLL